MLKRILRKIWSNKAAFLFFCLAVYFAAKSYCQKQETTIYKAKLEAVSALFKSLACPPCPATCPAELKERSGKLIERSGACSPCPKIEVPKCPLQDKIVQPDVSQPAPKSSRKSASREVRPSSEDYNDVLFDAVEAADKAEQEALKEDEPGTGQSEQINPSINRRDKNGWPKPPSSRVRVIRVPNWVK